MLANPFPIPLAQVQLTPIDLAGPCPPRPNLWQIQQRLQTLIERYLKVEVLSDRLEDLPNQFNQPQPRSWPRINWQGINASQIVGIHPLVFIAILAGAADTEDPIRGYTQTSRQYLEPLYPAMANFVGGTVDENGQLVELGLWEKEERQHAPMLQKLYTQLTGLKLKLVSHEPRPYQATGNPHTDLYRHGLHRIATEYGATCLYLWLMAHSTGPLQTVLEQLLLDEINHMTKFWGFGRWAFPHTSVCKVLKTYTTSALQKLWQPVPHGSLLHTLRRTAQVLHWEAWSLTHKISFFWTFAIALQQMHSWSRRLTPDYLHRLFDDQSGYLREG